MREADGNPRKKAPKKTIPRAGSYTGGMIRHALPLLLAAAAFAGDKDEWAPEVPCTTEWKDAIREAKNTGRILFIYNGWQREKI